jgi:hypothetical protein
MCYVGGFLSTKERKVIVNKLIQLYPTNMLSDFKIKVLGNLYRVSLCSSEFYA